MTRLRKMMLEELQRRNYAETTANCYLGTVEDFSRHFNCSPDRLGPRHIREYQAELFQKRKFSPNTVAQRLAGSLGTRGWGNKKPRDGRSAVCSEGVSDFDGRGEFSHLAKTLRTHWHSSGPQNLPAFLEPRHDCWLRCPAATYSTGSCCRERPRNARMQAQSFHCAGGQERSASSRFEGAHRKTLQARESSADPRPIVLLCSPP
jgi:hypothetical protein